MESSDYRLVTEADAMDTLAFLNCSNASSRNRYRALLCEISPRAG